MQVLKKFIVCGLIIDCATIPVAAASGDPQDEAAKNEAPHR